MFQEAVSRRKISLYWSEMTTQAIFLRSLVSRCSDIHSVALPMWKRNIKRSMRLVVSEIDVLLHFYHCPCFIFYRSSAEKIRCKTVGSISAFNVVSPPGLVDGQSNVRFWYFVLTVSFCVRP
jgi:hypothetical protein